MRFVLVLLLLVTSGPAVAADPLDIGWFADPDGTQRALRIDPFVPVTIHAVLFDAPDPIVGFEVGVRDLPASVFVIERQFFGSDPLIGGGDFDFVVGTGGCVQPAPRTALVSLTLFTVTTVPQCTEVFLSGTSVSSSPGGLPVVLGCGDQVRELGLFDDGWGLSPGAVVLNPIQPNPFDELDDRGCFPVSGKVIGFGALKARF